MCLPFEVRYMGTYVEDRGKIDYNDLRDTEHHANNASRVSELSTLGVSDTRTRRKLILYISLLHGGNYSCADILYKILGGLEDHEIESILSVASLNQENKDEQPLQELLLLYTMAHYHPSCSFEQKKRTGEILEKLQKEEARLNPPGPNLERLDGDLPGNCVIPASPMPYPPDLQMRPPIMSVVPSMTIPPPVCMPPGENQMSIGPSNPQYLPVGYTSAVPWHNQTVMMPMNQMVYPGELPGYPTSPMVSRQSSPSQSRSPSGSNSPTRRRSNSNAQRWTFEERKEAQNSQGNPMGTSSQANVQRGAGTSQRAREPSMNYSRHNSDSSNANSIDSKGKQPPPPRLRGTGEVRESAKESGFKNSQNYSREEVSWRHLDVFRVIIMKLQV